MKTKAEFNIKIVKILLKATFVFFQIKKDGRYIDSNHAKVGDLTDHAKMISLTTYMTCFNKVRFVDFTPDVSDRPGS